MSNNWLIYHIDCNQFSKNTTKDLRIINKSDKVLKYLFDYMQFYYVSNLNLQMDDVRGDGAELLEENFGWCLVKFGLDPSELSLELNLKKHTFKEKLVIAFLQVSLVGGIRLF